MFATPGGPQPFATEPSFQDCTTQSTNATSSAKKSAKKSLGVRPQGAPAASEVHRRTDLHTEEVPPSNEEVPPSNEEAEKIGVVYFASPSVGSGRTWYPSNATEGKKT